MNGNGAPPAGARVLLVEDQALIALDLQQVLRADGYQVLGPVPSVAGALALIQRERPDAAVLDLDLLDGWVTPVTRLLAARRSARTAPAAPGCGQGSDPAADRPPPAPP